MRMSKVFIVFLALVLLYTVLNPGKEALPIEDLDIPSGLGYDIKKDSKGNIIFDVPTSFYIFSPQDKVYSVVHTGIGETIGETREERQLKETNKYTLGLEKVFVISEESARLGLKSVVDVLMRNPVINDTAYVLICRGRTEDILKLKVSGYTSSADYIEGMIENLPTFNFFSNNFTFIDMYVRMFAEGRNLVLPYLELKGTKIEITGLALFDKTTLMRVTNMEEAKYINLLRENNVKGVFTLQENLKKYIDIEALSKRKVEVIKKDKNYVFNIKLDIKGDIITNNMYKNIEQDEDIMKKLEKDMGEYITANCEEMIKKIQNDYKIDCLELGRQAAAKYGRDTGTDWNEIIANSKIKVEVNFKMDRIGRGKY